MPRGVTSVVKAKNVSGARLQSVRDWVEAGHGLPVFERYDQIMWFVRTNYEELLRSGTYLPGRGSRPSFVTRQFAQVCTRIQRRQAQRLADEGYTGSPSSVT